MQGAARGLECSPFKNDSLYDSNFGQPPHLTDFAHIWHVNFFMGPNYEMDDFKFQ